MCHAGSSCTQLHSGQYWKTACPLPPHIHIMINYKKTMCIFFHNFLSSSVADDFRICWALNTAFLCWTIYQKHCEHVRLLGPWAASRNHFPGVIESSTFSLYSLRLLFSVYIPTSYDCQDQINQITYLDPMHWALFSHPSTYFIVGREVRGREVRPSDHQGAENMCNAL